MGISALLFTWRQMQNVHRALPPPIVQALQEADAIVVDQLARGRLPMYLYHVPPDTPVLSQSQKALLAMPPSAFDRLTPNSIYISDLSVDNTLERRRAILQRLWQEAPSCSQGKLFGAEVFSAGSAEGLPCPPEGERTRDKP